MLIEMSPPATCWPHVMLPESATELVAVAPASPMRPYG